MRVSAILALLISVSVGQDKPAVPFGDIVSCVRAGACRNMTAGTINWFDVVRIPVLTFKDNGWTYAVRYDPERPTGQPPALAIFLTPPNETQPTQSVTMDLKGELVRGSLGPQPGERVPADPRNGGLQASLLLHKTFAAVGWYPSGELIGAEFKPMWQKSADQALAAAARAIGAGQAAPDVRAIHEAVIRAIFIGTRAPDPVLTGIPDSFVVYAEYRSLRTPDDRTWRDLGPVPAELRQKVARDATAGAPAASELHTIDQFPGGAHILSQSEGLALIRGGPRDMRGYPALQQKYGAGNVLSLSKPLITDDGLDAFVSYSHGCGSACGTLGYVWLHRMSPGQPWTARVAVTAGS